MGLKMYRSTNEYNDMLEEQKNEIKKLKNEIEICLDVIMKLSPQHKKWIESNWPDHFKNKLNG